MKKTIIYLFLFVMLCFNVFAVGSVITIQTPEEPGLVLIYPNIFTYKQGIEFNLTFRAVNATGFEIENDEYNCSIHVYDNRNNHIIQDILTLEPNGEDQYFTINNSISKNLGRYKYLLECNNTEVAGFVSSGFIISNANDIDADILSIIIAFGIIAFLLLYFMTGLDETHIILKILLSYASLFILLIMIPGVLLKENLLTFFRMSNWAWIATLWYIPLYFILYKILEKLKEKFGRKEDDE